MLLPPGNALGLGLKQTLIDQGLEALDSVRLANRVGGIGLHFQVRFQVRPKLLHLAAVFGRCSSLKVFGMGCPM